MRKQQCKTTNIIQNQGILSTKGNPLPSVFKGTAFCDLADKDFKIPVLKKTQIQFNEIMKYNSVNQMKKNGIAYIYIEREG